MRILPESDSPFKATFAPHTLTHPTTKRDPSPAVLLVSKSAELIVAPAFGLRTKKLPILREWEHSLTVLSAVHLKKRGKVRVSHGAPHSLLPLPDTLHQLNLPPLVDVTVAV